MIVDILGHVTILSRILYKDVPKGRIWGEKILPEVTNAGQRFEGFLLRLLMKIYTLSGDKSKG